jgi:hypothetical protein
VSTKVSRKLLSSCSCWEDWACSLWIWMKCK